MKTEIEDDQSYRNELLLQSAGSGSSENMFVQNQGMKDQANCSVHTKGKGREKGKRRRSYSHHKRKKLRHYNHNKRNKSFTSITRDGGRFGEVSEPEISAMEKELPPSNPHTDSMNSNPNDNE